jgi:(p)ppGpp synthase/HD superfamily hydrolase
MNPINNQERSAKVKLSITTKDKPGSLKELVALARELEVNIAKTTATISNPLSKNIKMSLEFEIKDLDLFIKKLHKLAQKKSEY